MNWDPSAKQELDQIIDHLRTCLDDPDIDADEVIYDIGNRIEEELHKANLPIITAGDVKAVAKRLGVDSIEAEVSPDELKKQLEQRLSKSKRVNRLIIKTIIVCIVLAIPVGLLGTLLILHNDIQADMNKWCAVAQASHPHPGDNVAALLAYLQSEEHPLKLRNHVVWTLGQTRDARALPVLERYYTGQKCNHQTHICQYELEKAIKLCRGETPNIFKCIRDFHE